MTSAARSPRPAGVLLAMAVLVWGQAAGCSRQKTARSEPAGGRWNPVVLASADSIRRPPPPQRGSEDERREVAELVELTRVRTPAAEEAARFWNAGGTVRWNEIARDLVAKHRMEHAVPSRVYALLSVAQYDALVATWNNKYAYGRPAPRAVSSAITPLFERTADPSYPCEHAAVAGASAAVLAYLFPDEADLLERRAREHQRSRLEAGVAFRSDVTAGDAIGRSVARAVIERARADGADAVWTGTVPGGPGRWKSNEGQEPVSPRWGEVKPWLMKSGAQFRVAPPPAPDSARFRADLDEVRRASDTRTAEQGRTAALWADGAGSYAPPGRWNKLAADLIVEHRLNELRAARVFALLNMALMDAGIAVFESKYHYWVQRPWQADPAITTPIGKPNHPSYPSAHATYSGAGSEVLGYLFPDRKEWLDARAEEAARSRIYGGIHYEFDSVAGLAQGRAIAQLAIERGRSDGSRP